MSDAPRNIPVPDALAAVRAQIKALATREQELKNILLTDPSTRTGAAWVAEVKDITTTRVDLKELRAMHEDLVEEYTFPQKITRIELREISEDGELLPLRRKAVA